MSCGGTAVGSRQSAPARTRNISAASVTLRAIGPGVVIVPTLGLGTLGARPAVGLMP
jgi:hypothetical protein